jgi:hypothetical protein
MLTKIYAASWLAVVFAAGVILLTGNFDMLTAVIFGFIILGLVFMGMMSVLPASVAHPEPVQSPALFKKPLVTKRQTGIVERIHAFKADWMSSNGVEVRKPNVHDLH